MWIWSRLLIWVYTLQSRPLSRTEVNAVGFQRFARMSKKERCEEMDKVINQTRKPKAFYLNWMMISTPLYIIIFFFSHMMHMRPFIFHCSSFPSSILIMISTGHFAILWFRFYHWVDAHFKVNSLNDLLLFILKTIMNVFFLFNHEPGWIKHLLLSFWNTYTEVVNPT